MPTRITDTNESLLDVILTNKPQHFEECGVYNPEVTDHAMVYWLLTERAKHHQRKVVTFRDFKNLNVESRRETLSTAPRHVGEMLDSVDDSYDCWSALLNTILDEHMPVKG